MSRFYVGSEVGQLHQVLLHCPDLALERLTPSNCKGLLFDDVVRPEKANEEHQTFQTVLLQQGVKVLFLKQLLTETLASPKARAWILDREVNAYSHGLTLARKVRSFLESLNDKQLAHQLLGGLTVAEWNAVSGSPLPEILTTSQFILNPLPNHLFTRDASCWIYGGVSINPMAKSIRRREAVHLDAIYQFHPLFQQADFHTFYGDTDRNYGVTTIEGGDILVIGRGTVLIGMSERTTAQGVENLSRALFQTAQAKQVLTIELPRTRNCMHLDTVLSQMDKDCFTYYPEVFRGNQCWKLTPGDNNTIVFRQLRGDIVAALAQTLDIGSLRMVPTGGDPFAAAREQWNDANNVLAIRPGTVVAYERNMYTIDNMLTAGMEVLTIPGEDLGRGRGGTRCMSCPLERDDI